MRPLDAIESRIDALGRASVAAPAVTELLTLGGVRAVADVAYDAGPAECLHLLSTISMVRDDLAVVDLKRLPAGLYALLVEHGVELIPIPDGEIPSLGPNVLAVRPGVAVILEGNPGTKAALEAAGVEVHEFAGAEIAVNGSGGPTCLTRPLLRA